MDPKEKSSPDPLLGAGNGNIHIHILINHDTNLFVTSISGSDEEDWSEYLEEEHEDE